MSEQRSIDTVLQTTHLGPDVVKLCEFLGVESLSELPDSRYEESVRLVEAKRKGKS